MQGNDRSGATGRILLLMLVAVVSVGGLEGVEGAPVLTEINATPNPAMGFDTITVGSDGVDLVSTNVAYGQTGNASMGTAYGKWICGSVVPNKSGLITRIFTYGSDTGLPFKLRVFDYAANDETGKLLTSQADASLVPMNEVIWYDFTPVDVVEGARYWICYYGSDWLYYLDDIADGNHLRYDAAEPVEYSEITGTLPVNDSLPIRVFIDAYTDVQLYVKLTSGDYTSDYIAAGDYEESNPSVIFANPCGISCILQAKVYNETNGWSDEVQTTLYVDGFEAGAQNKTGIYITAAEWNAGIISEGSNYSGFLHNWRGFAAGSIGSYMGQILVDGAVTTTCNYEWDCMLNLETGSHTYSLFSTIGGYQYTGTFTIDANTDFVRIYIPLTYNTFRLWEDATEQTELPCSDIYSLTALGDVSLNKRIGVGLKIETNYLNWNSTNVVPVNCYSELNLPASYPFSLPGQKDRIEPLTIAYSGSEGITEGALYGLHFLNGIVGARNREGYLNFYDLHAIGEYYPVSGIWSGYVERRLATSEDGYYTPITTISSPNMNVDSALYGDANYNPGDFAIGNTVTCEAWIQSGGFVVYDINILLITDKNTIYDQFSFTPYKKYNSDMDESQPNGAFNLVWHTFPNVNTGHTGTVQCAVQAINELGYRSGWVYSQPRIMYSSNYTATGGMNIFVKYEDGTTSYMGHQSPYTSDLNNIDVYNWWHEPYYWGFDTSENPLTLFEGDGVQVYTYDRNASKTASVFFNINRGDAFDISLYLADPDVHDQSPVVFATRLSEQTAYTDRVYCKANFYDKDLDWNGAVFSFWTSDEGSFTNPLCKETVTGAFTTNCNPADAPCRTIPATETHLNECGSANDCYAEIYFSKKGCAAFSTGLVTGYCAVRFTDMNGNTTVTQASTSLTMPQYQLFAFCDAYSLNGAEKENVIFTTTEKGYIECLVGLDNVSEPSDLNWSVMFEGKALIREETIHDDYTDQDYFTFRIDATEEIEALAKLKSTDRETWEGDGTVFILHPVYGSLDVPVHITVTFVGKRTPTDPSEYSEENFNELYYWIDGFVKDLMTNPIRTVQDRFFEVLVITLFGIIIIPLLLVSGALALKKKQEGG